MTQNQIKKEAFNKPPFFISYFITDPIEYGSNSKEFEKNLRATLSHYAIDIICFRDKTSPNKKKLAKLCLDISREFNIKKVLINSNIELCKELGFDGIHFNSLQFEVLNQINTKNLFTIISCHTEKEVQKAKRFKIDAITYSPIFFKEFKGKPKGIENLQKIVFTYQEKNFDIIALGGIITASHIEEVIRTKARGFASIRYFKREIDTN